MPIRVRLPGLPAVQLVLYHLGIALYGAPMSVPVSIPIYVS